MKNLISYLKSNKVLKWAGKKRHVMSIVRNAFNKVLSEHKTDHGERSWSECDDKMWAQVGPHKACDAIIVLSSYKTSITLDHRRVCQAHHLTKSSDACAQWAVTPHVPWKNYPPTLTTLRLRAIRKREEEKTIHKWRENMKLGSVSVPIISVPRLSLVSRFSTLPARPHLLPFSLPPLPSQNPNLTSLSLSSARRCFHFRSHLSLLRSSSAAVGRFERRIATMGKRFHFQSYCSRLLWSLLFRLIFSWSYVVIMDFSYSEFIWNYRDLEVLILDFVWKYLDLSFLVIWKLVEFSCFGICLNVSWFDGFDDAHLFDGFQLLGVSLNVSELWSDVLIYIFFGGFSFGWWISAIRSSSGFIVIVWIRLIIVIWCFVVWWISAPQSSSGLAVWLDVFWSLLIVFMILLVSSSDSFECILIWCFDDSHSFGGFQLLRIFFKMFGYFWWFSFVWWISTSKRLTGIWIYRDLFIYWFLIVCWISAARNSFESILTPLAKPDGGEFGKYYSLPALNDPRIGEWFWVTWWVFIGAVNSDFVGFFCFVLGDILDKLPYSIRILLESAIRNCDEFQVKSKDVEKIIDWENTSPKQVEIPFKPARVLLQVTSCSNSIGAVILVCFFFFNYYHGVHLGLFVVRILLVFRPWLILPVCVMQWTVLAVNRIRLTLWYVMFLLYGSSKSEVLLSSTFL